jgi:two-component system, sensor histidine kinase RpfC
LKLTQEIAAGIPELILGDQGHLRQVLTNLVGNVIKFIKEGRVEVTVVV